MLTVPSDPSALLFYVVGLVILAVELWALVDACTRPAAAFPAADKLTKPLWAAILAGALLLSFLFRGTSLFDLVGVVAAIVYLVDVRPAVRSMRPGGPWG
jgi:hypothetical protein